MRELQPKARRIPVTATEAGMVYRTFPCAKCHKPIYQVAETAWEKDGKPYHEECLPEEEQ